MVVFDENFNNLMNTHIYNMKKNSLFLYERAVTATRNAKTKEDKDIALNKMLHLLSKAEHFYELNEEHFRAIELLARPIAADMPMNTIERVGWLKVANFSASMRKLREGCNNS